MFLTLKKVEVFQKAKITMFIIELTPFEASFNGFYKDKHHKFCAILTEIKYGMVQQKSSKC